MSNPHKSSCDNKRVFKRRLRETIADTKQPDSLDDLFDEYPQSLKPFGELKAAIRALQARAVIEAQALELYALHEFLKVTKLCREDAEKMSYYLNSRKSDLQHLTSKKEKDI